MYLGVVIGVFGFVIVKVVVVGDFFYYGSLGIFVV